MGQTACCAPESDNNMLFNPNGANMNPLKKYDGEKYTPIALSPKLNNYVEETRKALG